MKTVVVNCTTEKFDFYGGRPGFLGNPMKLWDEIPGGGRANRNYVLRWYKHYFDERIKSDADFRRQVLALKGKRLGCYCKPLPCHLDIVAAWLNNQ